MLYKAFISYSHAADDKLAPALQSALHNFAKPWYRLRSIRVFRDKTSLAANPALWPSIESALNESEYFLLLASPQAVQSPWVEREIEWWLENRSIERMLILLTDGELVWNGTTNDYDWERTTALPVSLRSRFKDEPLHVDLRWTKAVNNLSIRHPQFRGAVLDIAAPLFGKAKDELDGEDVRRHRKNKRWAWSAAAALLIATMFACLGAYAAFKKKQEAELQGNIAFSRQLATQSELLGKQQANLSPQSVLLAVEALKRYPSFAADQAMYHSLSLLGPKPVVHRSYRGLFDLVLSPGGKYLVQLPYDGPAAVQETVSGKTIADLINLSPDNKPLPAVRKVSFSADEKQIATLSSSGISAFVWDLPGGREIFRTPVNRYAIIGAVLSGDGNYLATGHADGMVYLWNISSGDEVLSFSNSDPPQTIKFSPDGRFIAVSSSRGVYYGPSSISMVRLRDVVKNREIAQLQHASAVTELTFSPDGNYLATTSRVGQEQEKTERIGTVKVFETATGHEVSRVQHENAVDAVTFTSTGKYLFTGSSDGTSRLWDVAGGQEQLRINHGSTVNTVGFLKIEDLHSFLITAGQDSTVRLWGAYSPAQEWLRLMEDPNIKALAIDADGRYLATISHDLKYDASVPPDQYRRDLRVWTVAGIREKLRLKHENAVGGVDFSLDGRYLATFDFQLPTSKLIPKTATTESSFEYTDRGRGSVSVWEVSSRRRVTHLKHPETVMSVDYDATGRYLVTACVDGIVRVLETPGGKETANLKQEGWVYGAEFSPDGRYVAACSGKPELLEGKRGIGMATIWEWRTGRVSGQLQSDYLIVAVAFSPDGRFLAAGGSDKTVHILRTIDGREIQQFPHDDPIWAFTFSPDGSYLATASGGSASEDFLRQKGATTLWKIGDGSKTFLNKHSSWVLSIAFSPDGKYLASIDQDGVVGIWATLGGQEIARIKHEEAVTQAKIHFSPCSHYLAAAFGNKARIWEIAGGKEVARREHGLGALWDVAFSPDGRYLATAGTDTTAGLWLRHPEDLIAEACGRLTQNLTHRQWRRYMGEEVPYHATCADLAIPED